jgi:GT2 family glycosyltransferase
MITPEASIIHYAGASEKVFADKVVRLMKAKISLVKRHFPVWQRPIGYGLMMLWPLSRSLAARALGRAEAAGAWGEVWKRRREWKRGYAEV